jgi:hypothetical protein
MRMVVKENRCPYVVLLLSGRMTCDVVDSRDSRLRDGPSSCGGMAY